MPIIKSAKKAVRQTKKRTELNRRKKGLLRLRIADLKKTKNQKNLTAVYSLADKLVKAKIIHKNKAKRIKSSAAKLMVKSSPKSSPKKTSKK